MRRLCRRKMFVVKHSINALGGNLLSRKLSDSISLLSLSKINLSEMGGMRKGDESLAILICFSAHCQVKVRAPFIHGEGNWPPSYRASLPPSAPLQPHFQS